MGSSWPDLLCELGLPVQVTQLQNEGHTAHCRGCSGSQYGGSVAHLRMSRLLWKMVRSCYQGEQMRDAVEAECGEDH